MRKALLLTGCFIFALAPLSGFADIQAVPEKNESDVRGSEASSEQAEPKGPLTILGLKLGLKSEFAPALLAAAQFKPVDPQTVKSQPGKRKNTGLRFDHEDGRTLSLTQSGDDKVITAIHYFIGEDIDAVDRLQTSFRARYGSPQARYTLVDEAQMLIWERVSPEQSRHFGPMTTIALTTGAKAKLSLTQFSVPEPSNFTPAQTLGNGAAKPLRVSSPGLSAITPSPVD